MLKSFSDLVLLPIPPEGVRRCAKLPSGLKPVKSQTDFEKRLHKFELSCLTRHQSVRVRGLKAADKETKRLQQEKFHRDYLYRRHKHRQEIVSKCTTATAKYVAEPCYITHHYLSSPLAKDYLKEYQRSLTKEAEHHELERRKALVDRVEGIEEINTVMRRAVQNRDELVDARKEKKRLLDLEKHMRARRDAARTEARYALAINEKQRKEMDRMILNRLGDSIY